MTDRKRAKNTKDFLRALDGVVARHAMLKHPFYQVWNEGKLSKETLAEYAKQYYAHVRMFPRYVSAVHSRCEDQAARQLLLENLIEEEQGENNHPELWLRFAEALGVRRDAAKTAKLLPSTHESVTAISNLTQGKDFVEGVAALYAYESQIPEVARTKRKGLKRFYGIADARSVSFFTVHEKADLLHRKAERDILARHCVTRQSQNRALKAAEESAKALWHFLDGVHEAYVK
jgi:pyrroloquinoline-quinone synthase